MYIELACWLIASSKNTIKTSEWTLPVHGRLRCFRGAFSQLRLPRRLHLCFRAQFL